MIDSSECIAALSADANSLVTDWLMVAARTLDQRPSEPLRGLVEWVLRGAVGELELDDPADKIAAAEILMHLVSETYRRALPLGYKAPALEGIAYFTRYARRWGLPVIFTEGDPNATN